MKNLIATLSLLSSFNAFSKTTTCYNSTSYDSVSREVIVSSYIKIESDQLLSLKIHGREILKEPVELDPTENGFKFRLSADDLQIFTHGSLEGNGEGISMKLSRTGKIYSVLTSYLDKCVSK